ncbi:hypothetical protein BGZ50_005063 [Haplosporangium sp. Z 11]|nr:hypothetical protein BGZ50_005063 [Haplosporangium sp. Z 11]
MVVGVSFCEVPVLKLLVMVTINLQQQQQQLSIMSNNLKSQAAAAGNPTPQSTPVSGPNNQEKGEFNILPIDEDKKYPPPPKGPHDNSNNPRGGPDLRSEFHVGPAMMPGPFISSMGANATAFEREHAQKAKKD